jgi:LmbE family N-acetylglucosaminyl deacetylase
LVVAPHPDDDVLTAAGVTYRALHASPPVPVWVVYMTNGDDIGRDWGYQRQDEAAAAEALLGVDAAHLVFLGYQDGSLSEIRGPSYATANSFYASDNPEVGNTTNGSASHPPYGRISGTNALNNGFNVRADLAHFLNSRRPTDIFVTGACDRHPDHSATYFFLHDALEAVRSSSPSYDPVVHQTIVWAGFNAEDDWPAAPNPATYYTQPVRLATCFSEASLVWAERESLDVPLPLQVANFADNLKARAINLHATQGGFTPVAVRNPGFDGHISAFVHKDEFFFSARTSTSNRPPVPSAGSDQSVSTGSVVTLNGSASFDPDGDPINYQWRQSHGPTVALSSTSIARPTFTVPGNLTNTIFAFELKVSNSGSFTGVADAVSISTGATPQPVDGGIVPLDASTPPVDAGSPPVDAGIPADASTGTPDAGTHADAGAPDLDAGAPPADSGPTDPGALDVLDAGIVDGSTGELDATGDATLEPPSTPFPGGEERDAFAQDADDIQGDDGEETRARKRDSGCGVVTGSASAHSCSALLALVLAAFLARRRA